MNSLVILAGALFAAGLQTGCPTWRTEHKVETVHKIEAHITIDIRQAVQAEADQFVGEVRDPAVTEGEPSASLRLTPAYVLAMNGKRSFLSLFDTTTRASAAEFTPAQVEAAKGRMKGRAADIDKWLTEGCMGENNKGFIDLKVCDHVEKNPADKAMLEKFAKEENDDRKIVYVEAAERQIGAKEHYNAIGMIFAESYRKSLKPGQMFQIPEEPEFYAEFLKTDLGKKFKDAKKGEWVKMK